MRILHFIYDHTKNPWVGGGGAVRVNEIYRRLEERHHITVISGKYPDAYDYTEGNLAYKFVGTDRNNYVLSTFCYVITAARLLRRWRKETDIIVEDFAPYNPLFTGLITRGPIILQVHHREGINLIERYSLLGFPFMVAEICYPRLFKNVITVSTVSRTKFSLPKATIIPNGIDQTLLSLPYSAGEYVAYVGRLSMHNKGLDTLLHSMANAGLKLMIAGKGRDQAAMRDLIDRLNLTTKVNVLGHVTDSEKGILLAASKIIIVPSRFEGQGIVVLEAAACGKPVIVSDIPELRYAVDAGFGVSFKTGDASDLAEKMKFLLDNKSLRHEMGIKARKYAQNFSWDKIAVEYEQYLLNVMKESGKQTL